MARILAYVTRNSREFSRIAGLRLEDWADGPCSSLRRRLKVDHQRIGARGGIPCVCNKTPWRRECSPLGMTVASPSFKPMLQIVAREQSGSGAIDIQTTRWRKLVADLRQVGALAEPDQVDGDEQLSSVLDPIKRTLPERHQRVLAMYQTDNMTLNEIGAVLGIDPSRVAQIRKRALQMMAARLKARRMTSSCAA